MTESVTEQLEQAQDLLASGDVRACCVCCGTAAVSCRWARWRSWSREPRSIAGFDDLAQAAAAVAGGDCSGVPERGRCTASVTRAWSTALSTWPSGRWPGRWNWRRTPRRCSASSSRPWSRTGSMRGPSPCSRSTSPVSGVAAPVPVRLQRGDGRPPGQGGRGVRAAARAAGPRVGPAREKVRRMLARAGTARAVTPLDRPGPARLALRPDRRRSWPPSRPTGSTRA